MNNDLFVVKRYLRAKSPDELVRLQLKNNLTHGITYKYDIIHDGSFWFAWFVASAKDIVKKAAEGEINA